MPQRMSLNSPCLLQCRLVMFALLALGTVLLSSCQETTPSPQPQLNPNPEQCQQWPAHYYCLVETGVSARVLGLRSPGESLAEARNKVWQLLGTVEEQWDTIASLETAEAFITYFRTQNLSPLAEAIEQTLAHNRAQEPTGGSDRAASIHPGRTQHSQLQAMAIRAGLIYAYRRVKGTWPR